jgi:hypothetical protein
MCVAVELHSATKPLLQSSTAGRGAGRGQALPAIQVHLSLNKNASKVQNTGVGSYYHGLKTDLTGGLYGLSFYGMSTYTLSGWAYAPEGIGAA